jgi:hypothetical protein
MKFNLFETLQKFIPSFSKKDLDKPEDYDPKLETQKEADSDSLKLNDIAMGGQMDYTIDFEQKIKSMEDLILMYRKMSNHPDVDNAVEIISSEAIIQDAKEKVKLNLDKVDISDKIKEKMYTEHENILTMLNFDKEGYDIFRQFYIDGRLYVQNVVEKNEIVKLKILNPLKLFPVKDKKTNEEWFLYRPKKESQFDYKIHKDHITMITSGIRHGRTGITLSNLHRSIVPLNQLETLEQSAIIYRLVRAPERRVFKIDVGRLPKAKAEGYVKRLMDKFRNKLTYNVSTGEVNQKKNQIVMAEDFWFPKDSEGRGTDVETLDGGTQLGEMTDIEYIQRKFFRSLKPPYNRMRTKEESPTINFGDSGELTREELKFYKYVIRVRAKLEDLFIATMKKQCILKKICDLSEWEKTFEGQLRYDWAVDNFYEEKKEAEITANRLELLGSIGEFIGLANNGYYSKKWVQRNILKQSDEEIEEMLKEMEAEAEAAEEAGVEPESPDDNEEEEPKKSKEVEPDETGETPKEGEPKDKDEQEEEE